MTELTSTIIPAEEAQDIIRNDLVNVLSNDIHAPNQDVWAVMFAALDRAIRAHQPPN